MAASLTPSPDTVRTALRGTKPPTRAPLPLDPGMPAGPFQTTAGEPPSVALLVAEIERYVEAHVHSLSDDQRTLAGMFTRVLRLLVQGQGTVVRELQDLDLRAPDLDASADAVAPPPPGVPGLPAQAPPVCKWIECGRPAQAELRVVPVLDEGGRPVGGERSVLCAEHLRLQVGLLDAARTFTVLPFAKPVPAAGA